MPPPHGHGMGPLGCPVAGPGSPGCWRGPAVGSAFLLLLLPLGLFFHKGLLKHKQPRDSGLRREAAEQSQCRAGRERARGGGLAGGTRGHGRGPRPVFWDRAPPLQARAVPSPSGRASPRCPLRPGDAVHRAPLCPRATPSHGSRGTEPSWKGCPRPWEPQPPLSSLLPPDQAGRRSGVPVLRRGSWHTGRAHGAS